MDTQATAPRQNRTRRIVSYTLKYSVPLLITVLLCKLLFNGIDFNEMVDIIRQQCNFAWIGVALAAATFSHVIRAIRWRIQLKALGVKVGLFPVVLSIFGTYAVNLVLPRLGELWRSGYIAKRTDTPFSAVFGSMVAERLADTLTVLLLTGVTFILAGNEIGSYLGENSATFRNIADILSSPWLWLGIAACIAAVWWFLMRPSKNGFVCKLKNFVRGLWQGFAVIGTMPGKGRWLLLTVCLWGCYFAQLYVAFYAFPFTEAIVDNYGAVAVLVAFVLSSISMGVPSNGGIGPWQWSVIVALGMYGLAQAPATAFANLVMGCQTLLLIVLGLFTFVCIAISKHREQ